MMIGQGGPTRRTLRRLVRRPMMLRAVYYGALWVGCLLAASTGSADEIRARLRVEWGGGSERNWQGAIRITKGVVSQPAALGLEADETATIYGERGQIVIRGRSGRVYDGVDLSVDAPRDAALRIELTPLDEPTALQRIELPVTQLLEDSHNSALDQKGNRLLARRAPGDKLRIKTARDHLVFAPGETWSVNVEPALMGIAAGSKLRLTSRLMGADNALAWSDEREWTAPAEGEPPSQLALQVRLPEQEGVYDLVLQLSRRGLTDRIGLRSNSEERRVQLVVISDAPLSYVATDQQPVFDVLAEIDPAQPVWWERFTAWPANLPRLPTMRRGPLGNGAFSTLDHPLGKLAAIGPGGREPYTAWEAYPLPVSRPGQPHFVEIEYPSDVAQTLGLSIVEPNAAGIVTPIGLDSGVYRPLEANDNVPTIDRHRLLFWPRSNSPLLLVTNRRHGHAAVYGKIRLLGPKANLWPTLQKQPEPPRPLPRAFPPRDVADGRLVLAYYDRPLFAENFGAPQAVDAATSASGRTLDDWHTFQVAGARLVEYLNYVGYNGAIVSALADGSTIYPSKLIEPTPRHDDGAFFASGQDPVRKDVLELLLRQFDREQLRLIPAVQLAAPLAPLEQLIRAGDSQSAGIELIGADGQRWLANHVPRQGLAPYYNPLHPRVQEVMLAVIAEMVDRYAEHSSFGGVALQMTADGYAQFPGADWGLDAWTLARFEQEIGVNLGAGLHADRVATALSQHRPAWLAWRSKQLAQWYQRASDYVAERKPGAKLYLLSGDILHRSELERELRPTLARRTSIDQLWSAVGIDPDGLRQLPNVTLFRPQRETPLSSLATAGVELEFNAAPEWDKQFVDADESAWLFFHPPLESRLASFESKSPFRKTSMRLVAEMSPGGALNRQRFAHALAKNDAQLLADGGWLLPLGQEDELRDLLATFRSLPRAKFETVPIPTPPVTIRTFADDSRSYLYLVNDSPWKATITLAVQAPEGCRLDSLGAAQRFPSLQGDGERRWWTIDLAPYDVVAGVFSSPAARVGDPTIRLPSQATDWLDTRIGELWARAATLKNPPASHALSNADFEVSVVGTLAPADWEIEPRAGSQAKLDELQRHGGRFGLHVTAGSFGAMMHSRWVPPPTTGRLSLSVWMRVEDEQKPPVVRVGVQGDGPSREWSRVAALGGIDGAQPLHSVWTQYLLDVPDLPHESLSHLRVNLEVVGAGHVWIDDIELIELDFSEAERIELSKIITTIEYARKSGELAECLRMLEGYWPRFLRTYVPLGDQPIVRSTVKTMPASQVQTSDAQQSRSNDHDRRGNVLERMKKFLPRWSR